MASDEDKLKRLKQLSEDISKNLKNLGKDDFMKGFDPNKVKDVDKEIEKLEVTLGALNQQWRDMNSEVLDLVETVQAVAKEINSNTSALKQSQSAYKGISSAANKLKNDALEIDRLSEKELANLTKKLEIELETVESNADKINQQIKDGELTGQKLENAIALQLASEAGFKFEKQLVAQAKARLKEEKDIKKTMGLTGALLKGIGGTFKKLGFDAEIFDDSLKAAEGEARKSKNSFKAMGAGLASIGKGIMKQMRDPLFLTSAIITGLLIAFKTMKDLIFSFSQEAVNLGRSFGTAGDQAQKVTEELRTMAATSDFLKGELIEGFTELNQSAGTFGEISRENLETYVGLTKQAGYSKELAQDLYKLSVLQGKSLKETAETEFNRIKNFSKTNNLAINQKEVFEEIGKMSAATQLSILGQGKALGDAAIQAKKLGMDMQTLNGIADSLLDFESSIAAELEAELLTGKQLNLERARAAALSNDMVTLGKELEKQNITAATFQKQNRIQQEATARALGLDRESLASSLLRQEAIRRGIVKEGQADLETQLKNLSVQEKFERTLSNIKEIFTEAIQPVISDLTIFFKDEKKFASFKNTVKDVAQGFVGIGKVVGSMVKLFTEAPEKVGAIAMAVGGLSAALIVAAVAAAGLSLGAALIPMGIAAATFGVGALLSSGGGMSAGAVQKSQMASELSTGNKTDEKLDKLIKAQEESNRIAKERKTMFVNKLDSQTLSQAQSQTMSKMS